MLTREQLRTLAETPLKPERVVTAHGTVYTPRLNAKDLSAFFDKVAGRTKGVELSFIMVDEFGTRLFAEKDADLLERLPASLTSLVTATFREVNATDGKKVSDPDDDSPTD